MSNSDFRKIGSEINKIVENISLQPDLCKMCKGEIREGEFCDKCRFILRNEKLKKIKENILSELQKAGVRPKYLNCSFDNYKYTTEKMNKTFMKIRDIPPEFIGSIFFTSRTSGTGKTHLAVAMVRKMILAGISGVKFVSSPFLFLDIKNSFSGGGLGEKEIIQRYIDYPVLVIDDIGVERVSDWSLNVWYMIISRRDTDLKTTIYTSNLLPQDIAERIDTRIASRMSGGLVFQFDGPDYRLRNR